MTNTDIGKISTRWLAESRRFNETEMKQHFNAPGNFDVAAKLADMLNACRSSRRRLRPQILGRRALFLHGPAGA